MNEFTTVDNIKEAFKRVMGEQYVFSYIEEDSSFRVFLKGDSKLLLKFEYDKNLCKVLGYLFVDPSIKEQVDLLFVKFDDFSNCQYITNAFFEQPISKIIFREPVCLEKGMLAQYRSSAQKITMASNFSYRNAWNMINLEQSYVITEDFKIKPIIDLSFNIRDFGFVRFFVDEKNNECLFISNSIDNYKGSLPYLNARTHISFYLDRKIKTIQIDKNEKNEDIDYFINLFIETMTPKLYQFFLTKFNIISDEQSVGSVDDFRILEILIE